MPGPSTEHNDGLRECASRDRATATLVPSENAATAPMHRPAKPMARSVSSLRASTASGDPEDDAGIDPPGEDVLE